MRRACALVAAALVASGCERDKPAPVQQAAKALEMAREDIEKARASIQATEKQSRALQEKIEAQRVELNDLVERRLTLLRQQFAEDEERIRRLPAPRETELRPRLGEIQKQLEDVELKLRAYRDAPPDKSKEALAALEKSLAALNERRRELEAQLRPA
jgi:chromosome segregation ATPase